jgi:hypothetical protein
MILSFILVPSYSHNIQLILVTFLIMFKHFIKNLSIIGFNKKSQLRKLIKQFDFYNCIYIYKIDMYIYN